MFMKGKMYIENFDKYYNKYLNEEISTKDLAKELNISIAMLKKLIKDHSIFLNETLNSNEDLKDCILEENFNWDLN